MRIPNPRLRLTRTLLILALALTLLTVYLTRPLLHNALTLAALPLLWPRHASSFYLSPEHDNLDLTFANYTTDQTSASPFEDKVPPVLHHISLGSGPARHTNWAEVRQSCLELHPGWKAFLWTDEIAEGFVREEFPGVWEVWREYRYEVQRVDALRYMLLYHYGGAVLDMDLQCKRALGPLRRFEFVAPAAHPTGFSIGFMMASKGNEFVGKLVDNLGRYDRQWLGLPYPTVMFSTGCHYASTIHALQTNRSELKVLAGPKENPGLHSLNGRVSTPLFNHLGSSSWHSYDAAMIVELGKSSVSKLLLILGMGVGIMLMVIRKRNRRVCAWYSTYT